MTQQPSAGDIQYEFYDRFFFTRDIEPYPVQEQAFDHIFAGDSVLVTVPTGTGKTMMAKAAIFAALRRGRTALYTTPLRALTEEKFRELAADFGEDKVGFATGDYKVRPEAPIQVVVAEILWNRIYGDRVKAPAEVVVMDEGHYFNDPERGYVWEQSIIGLDPRAQLVILSATVGDAQQFCNWVYSCRRIEMKLVQSLERKVPLYHQYKEQYLVETVKELAAAGEVPALIFTFGRELCFERARLLKSCPRFTTDEERAKIEAAARAALLERGEAKELLPLLLHGIGVHHAGILPRYKQLVEQLTLERLVKFVVSTETISAGINLPAKRVVFPSLRKHVAGKARVLWSAEYHQMAGRAGRPQFDTEGIALTLAPEEVVQEIRKELKDAARGRFAVDEAKVRKAAYARARSDAQRNQDVIWDEDTLKALVGGKPAALRSQTKVTAEQILAIGLPDLEVDPIAVEQAAPAREGTGAEATQSAGAGEATPETASASGAGTTGSAAGMRTLGSALSKGAAGAAGAAEAAPAKGAVGAAGAVGSTGSGAAAATGAKAAPATVLVPVKLPESDLPASMHLNIHTVIANLLVPDREKVAMLKRLAMVVANLKAMGVIDEHGRQVRGQMINKLRGIDGLFVFHCLTSRDLTYEECRELIEFLIDHDVIQKQIDRKDEDAKREWCRAKLRELRQEQPQASWEDAEAAYEKEHPRELTPIEQLHAEFLGMVPHPELHGGKKRKNVWAKMQEEGLDFMDFVEREHLEHEEGSLFTYLARVMKFARMLFEATALDEFKNVHDAVQKVLSAIDERVVAEIG